MEQTEKGEKMTILSSEALEAINRSEIDVQITTAKKFPRVLMNVLKEVEELSTLDEETAADCFYALKRGKGNDAKTIDGLSVRFAEILASCWGNIRVQTFIIGNDGKKITARGVCHDLEKNYAVAGEVHRRITDKYNKTFSEDMQVVTGNAASAIAYRNAVLKVIPKAIIKSIVDKTKNVAIGKALDLETSRKNAMDVFNKMGVTQVELFAHLEIKSLLEIDNDKLFYLRGLKNAIKEGTTSVEETFRPKKSEPVISNDIMLNKASGQTSETNAISSNKNFDKKETNIEHGSTEDIEPGSTEELKSKELKQLDLEFQKTKQQTAFQLDETNMKQSKKEVKTIFDTE